MIEDSSLSLNTYVLDLGGGNNQLFFCKVDEVSELLRVKEEDSLDLYKMINTLRDKLLKEREEHNRALEKVKKEFEILSLKLEKEHNRALEEYNNAIAQNKQYKEWYGTLISPILIIKELWNNGTIGELDKLIPPNRWRVGNGLGGEGGKIAKRYWLSQLEEWGLIKTWGKGFYMANVGMYEALEVLNKMMKKQKLIKIEKELIDEK